MNLKLPCYALLFGVAASCGARTGLPVPTECPSMSATTTRAPLDVFFMVDASGSMTFVTADGTTKWDNVRTALDAFLKEPNSAGIGAAITFFPHIDPAIPERCATDVECGVPMACLMPKICMPDPNTTACATDADCVGGGACKELKGLCLPNGAEFCESSGDCGTAGDTCFPIGACDDDNLCIPGQLDCASGPCGGIGACLNHTVCASSSYAETAQSVTALPGGASAILAAIDARTPEGATPTLSAITGAIASAKAWAAANPTHKVVVVMATDGLPTICDASIPQAGSPSPEAILHVADAAGDGSAAGVDTYVIGVFAPDEEADAKASLNQIAKAGGTGNAFLIETSQVVSDKLVEALTKVRDDAARCTFALTPESGSALDANRARVSLERPDGDKIPLDRVDSSAACGSASSSFYIDPSGEGAEGVVKIGLCPATCDAKDAVAGTEVDITFQCE